MISHSGRPPLAPCLNPATVTGLDIEDFLYLAAATSFRTVELSIQQAIAYGPEKIAELLTELGLSVATASGIVPAGPVLPCGAGRAGLWRWVSRSAGRSARPSASATPAGSRPRGTGTSPAGSRPRPARADRAGDAARSVSHQGPHRRTRRARAWSARPSARERTISWLPGGARSPSRQHWKQQSWHTR